MRSRQFSSFLILAFMAAAISCGGEHPRFANDSRAAETTAAAETTGGRTEVAMVTVETPPNDDGLDVPYVPTPDAVVKAMLEMAEVKGTDVLYDLGSGDGRIPITAARRFGTRGVGIDLDPIRVKEANDNAEKAKVTDKVQFIKGDIFESDFSEATVVTLYLLPDVNLKLKPTIMNMKPGTRVVSHNYDMGSWAPEKSSTVKVNGTDHYVYFWRVPEKK
jgi:hypothetical protein